MTIGIHVLEIHLPQARSLKSKRQVIKGLKDRLRSRYNVSVLEMEEHADLWQRAGLTCVSVASRRDPLDRLFDSILREAESSVPGSVIESGREFIDGEMS